MRRKITARRHPGTRIKIMAADYDEYYDDQSLYMMIIYYHRLSSYCNYLYNILSSRPFNQSSPK